MCSELDLGQKAAVDSSELALVTAERATPAVFTGEVRMLSTIQSSSFVELGDSNGASEQVMVVKYSYKSFLVTRCMRDEGLVRVPLTL